MLSTNRDKTFFVEQQPVKSYYDERVCDCSVGDERGHLHKRYKTNDGLLRAVKNRLALEMSVARKESVNPVVLNRRVRPNLSELDNTGCPVSSLLEHFTRRSFLRSFVSVNHSAGNFQRHLFNPMPVLLNHHGLFIRS